MYLRALPLLTVLALVACDPKDDTAEPIDSYGDATFHGQTWAVLPYAPPLSWENACTELRPENEEMNEDCDGDGLTGESEAYCPIDLLDCWACLELADDGSTLVWWGEITSSHGPYTSTGSLDLGLWTLVTSGDPSTYTVGSETWEVDDRTTSGDPWSQTARLYVPTGNHHLYQPGACADSPPPAAIR